MGVNWGRASTPLLEDPALVEIGEAPPWYSRSYLTRYEARQPVAGRCPTPSGALDNNGDYRKGRVRPNNDSWLSCWAVVSRSKQPASFRLEPSGSQSRQGAFESKNLCPNIVLATVPARSRC